MGQGLGSFKLEVIGHVKNDISDSKSNGWSDVVSEIVLKEEYGPLLDGIEGFSHIVVVFWMDRVDGYQPKVHPRGREDVPQRGVFATRTPFRPNPIGVSSVKLVQRRGNIIRVAGLDAFNGTPVLDIKPFTPKNLEIREIRVPDWMENLFGKDKKA